MTGSLSVLNVGAGDIKIVFNNNDEDESAKAIGMLKDMAARGYFIAVELEDGTYARATSIDATRGRYIVTLPSELPSVEPLEETPQTGLDDGAPLPSSDAEVVTCACGCGAIVTPGKKYIVGHHRRKKGKTYKVSVPVRTRHAVGVARSAGG